MKKSLLALVIAFSSASFADTYKIDTAASQIGWKAGKKIGSFHNGDIKVKSGTVETDKKGAVKAATVIVDMKTIGNEDLKENPDMHKKLVGHLSSDDFFAVEKHPEATFKLKSITPKADAKDEYLATGDLTMIGQTKPVSFPVKIVKDKDTMTATGTVTIERLKWGLKYGSSSIFKSLTADKIINDSFDLNLNLVAKK